MTFIDKDGQEIKVAVSKGDNLLDIAQAHDIEMEGTEVQARGHQCLFPARKKNSQADINMFQVPAVDPVHARHAT